MTTIPAQVEPRPARGRAAATAVEQQLRGHLSQLNALLVLSMLMTESTDEQQIVRLGATAAPSFARCELVGVHLRERGWTGWPHGEQGAPAPPDVDLPGEGGRVELAGAGWAWAYPLGGLGSPLGHLVVSAPFEPDPDGQFFLRVLAQQTGTAMRNARLHRQQREAAEELARVNARLEETVDALRRSMATHARLTRAAASGEGQEGIARAVHEVTGLPVAIEDRYGNLRAWAGPGRPQTYPKDPPARREQLLRRLLREGGPLREGGRLLAVASPRPDSMAVIALVDPSKSAGPADRIALEHGVTVLSMELARLRSVAEAELRVRRDLVEDLLAGADERAAVQRGEALGHDLTRPFRVLVFEGRGRSRDDEQFFHAARRAARDLGLGSLLVSRAGTVVLLTERELPWTDLHGAVLRELGGGQCRIGVGSRTGGVADFPASHREALLALELQRTSCAKEQVTVFDDLGVYRLLAASQDNREVERFVRQWIGPLLDYDTRKNADLVTTLSEYLECGGSYDATAKALMVHRSTLKYRLQRIRDVSQLALGDPDVNFNLQLACRAWRTLQAMRSPR